MKFANRFATEGYFYSLDDCSVGYGPVTIVDTDSSGSVAGKGRSPWLAYATCHSSDSSARRPNGAREMQFAALAGAVARLCELPTYDKLNVSKGVGVRVGELLGLLSTQTDVDPPKLFPQDEETLALTWTQGRYMRMLSVEEDDMLMLDVDKKSQSRCVHDLGDQENLQILLPALGVLPRVATAR